MVKPKKHLGQHFLKDESISKQIALSISYNADNFKIIEVGPGTGIASGILINISKEYICVEYSKENYQILKEKYPDIQSVNSDFLTEDFLDKKFETIISMANIYYFDFREHLVLQEDFQI